MRYRQRKQRLRQRMVWIQRGGFVLFLIGFVGLIVWGILNILGNFFVQKTFEEIVSQDVLWVANIKTMTEIKNAKTQDVTKDFERHLHEMVKSNFELSDTQEFWDMLKPELTIVALGSDQYVFLAPYKNKADIQDFATQWGRWEESLNEDDIQILQTGETDHALALYKDLVIFANETRYIEKALDRENAWDQNEAYIQYKKSVSGKDFRGYLNTKKWLENQHTYQFMQYYPLLKNLTDYIPGVGIAGKGTEDGLELEAYIGTTQEKKVEKQNNRHTVTRFVPKDVLFFWNGYSLATQYQEIKKQIQNPQAKLILEAMIQDWGVQWGVSESLLLDAGGHEYGLVVQDSEDADEVVYSLMTQPTPTKRETIQNALETIQGKMTPVIEVTEIEDGTEREDLKAQNPEDIEWIDEKTANGFEYKTVPEAIIQRAKLSYAFRDDYFLASSLEDGIPEMYSVYSGTESNILENEDFKAETETFPNSMNEWGFINISKLKHMPMFSEEKYQKDASWISFITDNFRNITIGKQDMSGGIFFRAKILFGK